MRVSDVPAQARVVVIGAGIVGNSMAYHLAQQGWKEIVLVDKGALPNPGGSTGHASNFIFLTDHSKEMTLFTLDSVRQYKELGVFTQSGGIEVARTAERVEELKRRMASSKAWGIDAELVSPAEVKRLVPYINEKIILGGFSTPGIGTVDSLRGGTLMREKAQAMGALTVVPSTEVTGIDVENGRVRRVRTDKGDIETDTVGITSGIWSPRSPTPSAKTSTRPSGTWTPTDTSASMAATWRWAPTTTVRSCGKRTISHPSDSPRSRRPSCPSPRKTSTSRSSTRSS